VNADLSKILALYKSKSSLELPYPPGLLNTEAPELFMWTPLKLQKKF